MSPEPTVTPDAAGIEAALADVLAAHASYRYAAKDEDDEKGERHFIRCNGCQARIMAPTYGAQGEVHCAHVAAALLPVVTQAQAAERERIARAIESVRIVCPDHHIPDCSPLLNGCSVVIRLRARSAEDARIARADESGAR